MNLSDVADCVYKDNVMTYFHFILFFSSFRKKVNTLDDRVVNFSEEESVVEFLTALWFNLSGHIHTLDIPAKCILREAL